MAPPVDLRTVRDGQWWSPVAAPTPPAPDPAFREGWGLPVFRDDFDSGPLDLTRWYRRGLPGGDYFLTNTDRQAIYVRENSYVDEGAQELIIKTQRRESPLTPDPYTRWWDTGYIDTMPRAGFAGFEQRYGRFEARVHSLHPMDTAGIWSAFWLRTRQDGGEVDVFEHVGTPTGRAEDGTTSGSWPYASRWPNSGIRSQAIFFEETGQTNQAAGHAYHECRYDLPEVSPGSYFGWHTYACEWTPDRISCYCDGMLTGEIRRGQRPTNTAGQSPTGPNGNVADGAMILDGGFGGSAAMHMRLCVQVGFPGYGYASTVHTMDPHYFRVSHVYAWEWDGQE